MRGDTLGVLLRLLIALKKPLPTHAIARSKIGERERERDTERKRESARERWREKGDTAGRR